MDPFPPTLTTKDNLQLTVDFARPEELDEICEFLQRHFLATSPNRYLIQTRITDTRMKNFFSKFLQNPVSLTVRDPNGRLVAVRLNDLEDINASEAPSVGVLFNEGKKELIESLFEALEKGINLFEKYNTDKLFSLVALAVDQSYGRLGLGTTLVSMSFELAQFYGAGAVQVHAVNEYAAKVASKHGMETLKTIHYSTFEVDGERPLANIESLLNEHSVARFMAGPPNIPPKK